MLIIRLNKRSITDKIVHYGASNKTLPLYHEKAGLTIYKCHLETAGTLVVLQFGAMSKGNITLKNVTKYFGDTVAVNDISLEMGGGEFFSLLGPSGCGKTTTLRMIGGFDHPTSGEIFINDTAIGRTPPLSFGCQHSISELCTVSAQDCLAEYRVWITDEKRCQKADRIAS